MSDQEVPEVDWGPIFCSHTEAPPHPGVLPGRNPRLRSLGAPQAHGSPAAFLHGPVPVCSLQSHSGPARQRGQIHLMLGSASAPGAEGDLHLLPTEPPAALSDSHPVLTPRAQMGNHPPPIPGPVSILPVLPSILSLSPSQSALPPTPGELQILSVISHLT